MSSKITFYVMVAVDVGPNWIDENGGYEQFEEFMSGGVGDTSVIHDGMSGEYTKVGLVLAREQDYEFTTSFTIDPQELKNKIKSVQDVNSNMFGIEETPKLHVFFHYH